MIKKIFKTILILMIFVPFTNVDFSVLAETASEGNTFAAESSSMRVAGTINYLDENGSLLHPSADVSSEVGSAFTWTLPLSIAGYQVDYAQSSMVTKINGEEEQSFLDQFMAATGVSSLDDFIELLNSKIIAQDTESVSLNYVYSSISVAGTINYLDDNGNQLHPPVDVSSEIGATFTWTLPLSIAGYQVDYAKSQMIMRASDGDQQVSLAEFMETGDLGSMDQLVEYLNEKIISSKMESVSLNYVYTRIVIKGANVTVSYIDGTGTSLKESIILTGNIGDIYTTEQISFPGYVFKEVRGEANGSFTDQEQKVEYIYEKETESDDIDHFPEDSSDNGETLPNTGVESEQFMILMGSVIAIIGSLLVIFSYRKKKDF